MTNDSSYNIVHEQNFIRAARDTGYRSTASAVAELVDNAIQAKAKNIRIFVTQEGVGPRRLISVAVLDDGCGMDGRTLRTALRFGGSSRFDDREGPGRFGMGLPNSSVSQARRVDVYTWRQRDKVLHSYIDVDEIAEGVMAQVPPARRRATPEHLRRWVKKSGTLVMWSRCDRLDNRKAATIARHLEPVLGQQFRTFLWNGLKIFIDGQLIEPVDPLFLHCKELPAPAQVFGEPLTYEVQIPHAPERTSVISVRFSELPISKLHSLPDEDKRRLGISKGAGVSVLRAGREVDFGWHFMGRKRRENYDDWWRCEVAFDPELDELFGVTHSKQQITPTEELRMILAPDMESIAHALNARVRAAYTRVRVPGTESVSQTSSAAVKADAYLPEAAPKQNGSTQRNGQSMEPVTSYAIRFERLRCPEFYTWRIARSGKVTLTVNTNHPFYEHLYQPRRDANEKQRQAAVEMLLLALARTEIMCGKNGSKDLVDTFRRTWSDTLATYLGE